MKETNLQKTKKRIVECIIDCAEESFDGLYIDFLEYFRAVDAILQIKLSKRMREVDTVVKHYFGFNTAQEFLAELDS
jgi:hypothetical protein